MKTTNETVEVLNDLIQINNDRIVGYERALKDLKAEDLDLKPIFMTCIDQSRTLKIELGDEVQNMGGTMDSTTTASGKLYRAWMEVKNTFTGHDRHSLLASCEYGEDAAQKAYSEALREDIPAYLRELIAEQQKSLKGSHDEIRSFRDQALV